MNDLSMRQRRGDEELDLHLKKSESKSSCKEIVDNIRDRDSDKRV
jgi:hypothetical protein